MENNWKPGDIAICVKVGQIESNSGGNTPPLRLKAEYNVNSVRICECGAVTLDVGLALLDGKGTVCNCGAISSGKTGIWWAHASRFVKKQTKSESKYNSIEEAIFAEDYLEAANMRDNA